MPITFAPAHRRQAHARIALCGPPGSGKTWTALTTAEALGKKIAVIDTERGSASKYARVGDGQGFSFDVVELTTFSPLILIETLAAAAQAGYDVVIIDSLSLFWSGVEGMLEQVEKAGKRAGGGPFAGWKEARPMERQMIDAILSYPGHVIVTIRTKTEWIMAEDEKGKKAPTRVGTKPEQRDGIEYEFDVVADMDIDNTLTVSKSRCPDLASAVIKRPDAKLGQSLRVWLETGEAPITAFRGRILTASEDRDALRQMWDEAKTAGLLSAACTDLDGHPTTIGALIGALGRALPQDSSQKHVQEVAA